MPQESLPAEDEISLVDLIAVLLRWRRLIIIPTALAALLAGAWVLLGLRSDGQDDTSPREAVLSVSASPGVVSFLGQATADGLIDRVLADPAFLAASLRESGVEKLAGYSLKDLDEARYLYAVRELLVRGRGLNGAALGAEDWLFKRTADKGRYQLAFRYRDQDKAIAFLRSLSGRLERALGEYALPLARRQVELYESLAASSNEGRALSDALSAALPAYMNARRLVDGLEPLVSALHEPYVVFHADTPETVLRERVKVGILVVMAMVFLSILCAFLAQAVWSVRRDASALEKIRSAWYKR